MRSVKLTRTSVSIDGQHYAQGTVVPVEALGSSFAEGLVQSRSAEYVEEPELVPEALLETPPPETALPAAQTMDRKARAGRPPAKRGN